MKYIVAWYRKPEGESAGPQEIKWAVVEADSILNARVILGRELEELSGYEDVSTNVKIVHAQLCDLGEE